MSAPHIVGRIERRGLPALFVVRGTFPKGRDFYNVNETGKAPSGGYYRLETLAALKGFKVADIKAEG